MAARYQVRLKDQAGVLVAVITDWYSLEYSKRVNAAGNYSLVLDGGDAVRDLFELDGQVEVWRSDLAASPAIDWYVDFEGFHRTQTRSTNEENRSQFVSSGAGYTDLLRRRAIAYRKGTAQADKSGVGETVIKEYVNENAGPGAILAPRLISGVFPGFTLQGDLAQGLTWTGERALRNLLEVAQEIARITDIDFQVIGIGPALYEFRARSEPLGDDRTTIGVDPTTGFNAAGNPPVVFSLEFGNMLVPVYRDNRSTEVTRVILSGQGSEDDRTFSIFTTSGAVSASPWNAVESVHDSSDETEETARIAIGTGLLEKLKRRETLTWQFSQTPGTLLGRDYFFGDQVTGRYQDIERNLQIVGLDIRVIEGIEDITVQLSDVT
jgi:hypothetical protein